MGYDCLSAPSPCERLSRLRVLWADPTPDRLRLSYLFFRSAYLPSGRNKSGLPSSCAFLSTHATLFVDPGRPSESSPFRFLCVGFWLVNTIAICILDGFHHRRNFRGYIKSSGSTVFPVAYVVPCVRFNDVVRSLMSDVCVPDIPGSLKSLASLLQRRGFLYATVTPLTGLSGLLHHCNTRYEWLVRPCSTGTFTLQETPSFAWRTNGCITSGAGWLQAIFEPEPKLAKPAAYHRGD